MIQALIIFLVTLINILPCLGQTVVIGKVLNSDTNEPIPYANIGIPGSSVGSISDHDGSFNIPIPSRHLQDSLTFSAVGYGGKKVAISYFSNGNDIEVFLDEKLTMLNEVLIEGSKEKRRIYEVGNRSFNGGVLEPDTIYAGRAIALLINSRKHDFQFPLYLENANLRILRNNLPSFKFRVRLNAVDSTTGEPGVDLLEKSLVVESRMRNGWLEFDLSSFQHLIYKPFFVTFEQILERKDRVKIAEGYRDFIHKHPERLKIDTVVFEGKKEARQILRGGIDLPGTFVAISSTKSNEFTSYQRETSLAAWKKVRGIVTAYVTLHTQRLEKKN
jgi:hypothetical protein